MKYQIQIQESGSGKVVNLTGEGTSYPAFVETQVADKIVNDLEKRFDEWAENDFPALHPNDALNHWEGCDVIAIGEDGETFLILDEDTWEVLD